jgi:stage V sporulation protein SpoVS
VESVGVAGGRRGAVEATVGLQVPLLGAGAGYRIAVEPAPAVLAHHEQPHGRGVGKRVVVALEGGVIPAQVLAVETTAAVEGRPGCGGAEVELSGVAEVGAVRPGADEQMGRAAAMARGHVAHRRVLAQRAGGEDVVPAADVEGVGVDALVGVVGPRPAIERGVERAAHGGDNRPHQTAGEIGELAERQQVKQLPRCEPGSRRAEIRHRAGEFLGIGAMSTQKEVGTDLELQPTQA